MIWPRTIALMSGERKRGVKKERNRKKWRVFIDRFVGENVFIDGSNVL